MKSFCLLSGYSFRRHFRKHTSAAAMYVSDLTCVLEKTLRLGSRKTSESVLVLDRLERIFDLVMLKLPSKPSSLLQTG